MTENPPDRFGLSDEQEIEVEEWNDDLGQNHEIVEDSGDLSAEERAIHIEPDA